MLQYIFSNLDSDFITLLGILFAFCMTCFALAKWSKYLPKDFAHDGKLSAGKPRGAGFVFIIVFCVCSVLFGQYHNEFLIYAILVAAAMMTGFLDDCARMPWGEYSLQCTMMSFAKHEEYWQWSSSAANGWRS